MELAYGMAPTAAVNDDDGIRETLIGRKTAGLHYKYRIYDVVGLHSKDNKWIYSIDEISTLIYVVDVSEYCPLASDVSCIQEDLALFQKICSSKWLATTPILLLMSNTDVLTSKLRHSPIGDYFPDYTGSPHDLEAAKSFFRQKYLCLNQKYGLRIRVVFTGSVATVKLGKAIVANVDKILIEEKVLAFGAK
ncbi:guanine nucleotide-binding protein subunit alpha [Puttea exsequens]|nr:guanine nucleotide-binding protein subunit alpha [Puttea exsequens]